MPNFDEKTPSGWPLPFKSNTLEFDVERLRETFLAVDEALSSLRESFRVILDEKFYGLEEKQYILDERMDVIAGQTTEDSEVLDARVGRDGTIHPCLGEHIRSVYGVVSQAVRDIEYGVEEFAGLVRQFNSLAEAQIQGELNSHDAHERRKLEIARTNERVDEEVLDRQEGDSVLRRELEQERQERHDEDAHLQEQADTLSEASIRHSLNLEQEAQRRREGFEAAEREATMFRAEMRQGLFDLDYGVSRRFVETDDKIHATAGAFQDVIDAEILQERTTRNQQDDGLQKQINDAAQAILRTVVNLREVSERFKAHLTSEEAARISGDDSLQREINTLAEAFLRDALTLSETLNRRREALKQEIQARIAGDANLQEQITRNAEKIQQESDQRAESDAEIHEALDVLDEGVALRKLEIDSEVQARAAGDEGLARQANANAEATLRTAFTLHELNARRKAELTREEQARIAGDADLQRQINKTAEAALENSLGIQHEAEERRKVNEALNFERVQRTEHDAQQDAEISRQEQELSQERQIRDQQDEGLQHQVDSNAEATLRTAFTLHELNARRKAELTREEQARIAGDADLQIQLDKTAEATLENSLGIQHEAEQRRKSDERIEALKDESSRQSDIDAHHQRQIDAAVLAILQNTLTLSETLALHREALLREEHSRHEEDANQQAQTDTNAFANMRNSLNIQQEADQRRKVLDRLNELRQETQLQLQVLRNEMGLLYEIPLPGLYEQLSGLQAQANHNAEAAITNTLNLSREAQQRRELSETLSEADTFHQRQIDALISAILENSVNLHSEVARRIEAVRQERNTRFEGDTALREEIDTVAQAVMRNILALNDALSHQREVMNQEARTRAEEDSHLQRQADMNAVATMELAANLSHEAEQRRKLADVVAGLTSPVDWSKAETLAIPEPRCAVVNFSGPASMPTSKTVDIPAVLEFWDLQGNYFKKPIVCSAQGAYSMNYIKKNVKFDLLNQDGSEFNLKIGDWVSQDGFHLKAYYVDFFRGIAVTAYDLWEEIMRFNGPLDDRPYKKAQIDRSTIGTAHNANNSFGDIPLQTDTGALCHPDGFPCVVYLNGTFYGVFSWQLKKQRKNYRMDKSTVEHIHIDGNIRQIINGQAVNWTTFELRNPNKLYTMNGKKYDGDAPLELIDETSEKFDSSNNDHVRTAWVKWYVQGLAEEFTELQGLYAAYLANKNDETLSAVRTKFEALFDWQTMRDYTIFIDITHNWDGITNNVQWTTYDGMKWFPNAYDLDLTFSRAPLTGHLNSDMTLPFGYVPLLYGAELEERYGELRDAGIISVEGIASKLEEWVKRVGPDNYELEYQRWPQSAHNDSVYRVRKWLEVNIANMDKVYRYSPADSQPAIIEEIDETEFLIRSEQDVGILKQVASLAEANMQGILNFAATNEERRREEERERQTRHYEDLGILRQINALAEADMWRLINEHDSRLNISEVMQKIQDIPARKATDAEFDEMLDELYKP